MRGGLWTRIKTVALTDVSVLVKGMRYDTLEQVERVLLEADFGPVAFDLVESLEAHIRRGELKSDEALRRWLVDRVADTVGDGEEGMNLGDGAGPGVVLLLGVNGVGKTTQAAKIAHWLQRSHKSIVLAAADTFRAGAGEQLQVWAKRLGVDCICGSPGGDPASVAFDAVEAATARGADVVLVDTAGRLHTQGDLIHELQKIVRVVGRKREGAPHETFLVLDASVGQNALSQGKVFAQAVPISGLIVTKLDGTAKGGAVAVLRRELGIPIRFIGVGEGLDDLEVFDPRRFAERLVGD